MGRRVLIFPEVQWKSRQWPEHNFQRLAWLLASKGYNVVAPLMGQPGFNGFPDAIWSHSVPEISALIKRADLVISGDTGPVHFAGTLGVKTLVLCGPSKPELFFDHLPSVIPMRASKEEVPCVGCNWWPGRGYWDPCNKHCFALAALTPWQVLAKALELLPQPKIPPPVHAEEEMVSMVMGEEGDTYRSSWDLKETKMADGTEIGSEFQEALRKLILREGIFRVVETGTYLGLGSTTCLSEALGPEGKLCTVEVNPDHYRRAQANLRDRKNIKFFLGLSVPKNVVPSYLETQRMIDEAKAAGMRVDTSTADFYMGEVNHEGNEDWLSFLMEFFNPQLIFLDSAGHMGETEFRWVHGRLEGGTWLALDDVDHVKHWKTMKLVGANPRFKEVFRTKERNGAAIFRFEP